MTGGVDLRVRDLRCALSGREVLRGVSFDACAGEVVAIIGPNGGGKSTICRCVAGLVTGWSGEIFVGGRDIGGKRPPSRLEMARLVSYAAQDCPSDSPFTVRDFIAMSRYACGTSRAEDDEICLDAMKMCGVEHLADRPLAELSGGERRLALIAATAAQCAPCAILDEPTAALDFAAAERAERAISRMSGEMGATVIVVTHDVNFALRTASLLLAVKDGEAVSCTRPSGSAPLELLSGLFGVAFERWAGADGASIAAPSSSGLR